MLSPARRIFGVRRSRGDTAGFAVGAGAGLGFLCVLLVSCRSARIVLFMIQNNEIPNRDYRVDRDVRAVYDSHEAQAREIVDDFCRRADLPGVRVEGIMLGSFSEHVMLGAPAAILAVFKAWAEPLLDEQLEFAGLPSCVVRRR